MLATLGRVDRIEPTNTSGTSVEFCVAYWNSPGCNMHTTLDVSHPVSLVASALQWPKLTCSKASESVNRFPECRDLRSQPRVCQRQASFPRLRGAVRRETDGSHRPGPKHGAGNSQAMHRATCSLAAPASVIQGCACTTMMQRRSSVGLKWSHVRGPEIFIAELIHARTPGGGQMSSFERTGGSKRVIHADSLAPAFLHQICPLLVPCGKVRPTVGTRIPATCSAYPNLVEVPKTRLRDDFPQP